MKAFRKTAAVILALAVLFASSVMVCADFDKTTLAGGIFQLNAVHSIVVPALENKAYTVWTSAVCFAAGRDSNDELLLVTDAALARPDRVFDTLSEELLTKLSEDGIEAERADLPSLVSMEKTIYYLVYDGSLVELSTLSQTVSNNVLVLKPKSPVESAVFSYAYADTYKKGDTVHTFSLSGTQTDGIIDATEDAVITNWSFTTQPGSVMIPATVEDGNISCTMSDIPMTRANQGSALFDDDGNVIGLNVWMENSTQLISLTSSAVMAILDQAGISYIVNETSQNGFSITEAVIYLAIALALIIILVIILIVLHSRKKKLEEDDISQLELEASRARAEYARQQNAVPQPRPMSARPAAPYNPASATKPAAPASVPVPPPQVTSVMLTVIDGPMKGLSAQIDGRYVLGRDPDACNVVFSADAAAVSRRHCAVSFNKNTGRVLLEDLSSSNGTYFPSGTRIIPGRLYALRSGDRFYLGLPENLVEVRMK